LAGPAGSASAAGAPAVPPSPQFTQCYTALIEKMTTQVDRLLKRGASLLDWVRLCKAVGLITNYSIDTKEGGDQTASMLGGGGMGMMMMMGGGGMMGMGGGMGGMGGAPGMAGMPQGMGPMMNLMMAGEMACKAS